LDCGRWVAGRISLPVRLVHRLAAPSGSHGGGRGVKWGGGVGSRRPAAELRRSASSDEMNLQFKPDELLRADSRSQALAPGRLSVRSLRYPLLSLPSPSARARARALTHPQHS
jgi:hypothetical protein